MATSNNDETIETDKDSSGKPKTRIVRCLNEFQEKLYEAKLPPPPLVRFGHNPAETEYNFLDEIKRIHQLIKDNGEQGDFGMQMKFGPLIPLYGNAHTERLSEVLAIARKNGYVNYTLKDYFQQDRDEDIFIRLVKTPF